MQESASPETPPVLPPRTTTAEQHHPRTASQGTRTTTGHAAAVDNALHQDVSTLSSQLDTLGLEPAAAAPADTTGPIPLRAIRPSGPPLFSVQFCPGSRIVTHASPWYHIVCMPDQASATLVCTRCYHDLVAPTALAGQWAPILAAAGSAARCCFYTPRVRSVLWPQAVLAGDMYELRVFLARSASLEACPGEKPTTGVPGTTWYGLLGNDIEGFTACETCYENYVAGGAFEGKFAPFDGSPEDRAWTCHMRGETIGGIAAFNAERDDWQAFIEAAFTRLRLPECTGKEVQADAIDWYIAREAPVCATCYLDHIATTPFAAHVQKYRPQLATIRCSLGSLPALGALEAGLEQRDFDVFAGTLGSIARTPRCTAEGIVDGTWATLAGGGCPDFAVCYACFAGLSWMRGMHGFLEPAGAPPGAAVRCSFHPSHPRFAQHWRKACEVVDRGVFAFLAEHVRAVSGVRVCARNGGFAGARWWGYDDARFCEDCFVTYVRDTALGGRLSVNGAVVPEVTVCQIWSPRMRHYWEEVCGAGEPGEPASDAALEDFRGVCRYRKQTYLETLSEIEVLKQMKGIQRQQAMFEGLMSVQYQGIDSMASLVSTQREEYGSDALGWWDTRAGVESRVRFGRFTDGMAGSQLQPSEMRRILALQEMWKKVE